jgi:lipoate-protein ligase A
MKYWRMILSGASDAFFNMALDEALLVSCNRDISPPVVRLYQWNPPAVSIGYSQLAERTVDARKCRKLGVDMVRRITGGRAVLHEDEITYSVCASTSHFPELGENVTETYRRLSMALLQSLRSLGIDGECVKPSAEGRSAYGPSTRSTPCFLSSSRYEMTVGGRKLIGSAQRRFSLRSGGTQANEIFIQHGSIPTGPGRHSLADLLPQNDLAQRFRRDLPEKSTNLQAVLGRKVSLEEMACAMKTGFEETLTCHIRYSVIREQELQMAQVLNRRKYGRDRWNFLR